MDNVSAYAPDRIVLSPGPGHPKNATLSNAIIESIRDGVIDIPTLGVCLGHQCMGLVFGGAKVIKKASEPMHGKTSTVHHTGTSIFYGIPSPFRSARYHSLIVSSVPKNFELLAWTMDSHLTRHGGGVMGGGTIMAMRHTSLPLIGVQFHPESFMTEHGATLMKNFLAFS